MFAERILKYLKKTKSIGLKYSKNGKVKIEGYVDANWANDNGGIENHIQVSASRCQGLLFPGVINKNV